jgi:hypothetical protein
VQVSRTTWGAKRNGATHATHTRSVEQSCPAGSLAGRVSRYSKISPAVTLAANHFMGICLPPVIGLGFKRTNPMNAFEWRSSTGEQQPRPIPTGWVAVRSLAARQRPQGSPTEVSVSLACGEEKARAQPLRVSSDGSVRVVRHAPSGRTASDVL